MNPLNKIKLHVILISSAITFFSCSKDDSRKCELWEVKDQEHSTVSSSCGINWSCGGSRTLQLYFCDAALQDASVGNTVILSDDPCCKKTRTFIRKV